MRILAKLLLALVVLGLVGVSGAWVWAGRQTGPTIQFRQPDRFVGQDSNLQLTVEAPEGRLSQLDVTVEQGGKSLAVFNLDRPADGAVKQDAPDRFFVIRPIGKKALPDLKAGPATIVVVGPEVSTEKLLETSAPKFPRLSRARTRNEWEPSDSAEMLLGLVQAANKPPSIEHSRPDTADPPESAAVKEKVTLLVATVPVGPELMVATGPILSS